MAKLIPGPTDVQPAYSPPAHFAQEKKKVLELLAISACVSEATHGAGVGRRTYYEWRKADAEFAIQSEKAIEASTAGLEAECRRRAMKGSDLLLIFLLKARKPDVYRENIKIEYENLSDDVLYGRLAQLARKGGVPLSLTRGRAEDLGSNGENGSRQ
jgi:hypothetical protein